MTSSRDMETPDCSGAAGADFLFLGGRPRAPLELDLRLLAFLFTDEVLLTSLAAGENVDVEPGDLDAVLAPLLREEGRCGGK